MSNMQPNHVPMDQLVPSKTNPRKLFPAEELAELADSIRRHGIIQPLLVRPTPDGDYEIVCGERRWRAAREAGLQDVPVMVRELSTDEVLEIQIVENLQRKDLSPMEEADGYNVLLQARYTYEQIAEKVGRSRQYVFDRARLLRLVKGAADLLRAGRIEVSHAILLARLAPEDQVRVIREPDGRNMSGEATSGLWQMQRDLPRDSNGERDSPVELKPVSARELAAWIQRHVRLRPEEPETGVLFPEVARAMGELAAALTPEGEESPRPKAKAKPVALVEITTSHQLADDVRDPKRRVLTVVSWARADGRYGSSECPHSVLGVVVAGAGQGEAFRVCTEKQKCTVHWKREIDERKKREREVERSGKTGEDREALERKRRAEAEAAAKRELEQAQAAYAVVARALIDGVKALSDEALVKRIVSDYGPDKEIRREFPSNMSPADCLRFQILSDDLPREFTWSWAVADAMRFGKSIGVDVAKLIKAHAATPKPRCRVCGLTESGNEWAEDPDPKTGSALCVACAEKAGGKAAAAVEKKVAQAKGKAKAGKKKGAK